MFDFSLLTYVTSGSILLLIILLIKGIFVVTQQEIVILETLGKFNRIAFPGLNFKIPFITNKAGILNTQIQQIKNQFQVKSKDNCFIGLPIALQYKVYAGMEQEAFYKLKNPIEQMQEFIANTIRAKTSTMTVDELFSSANAIQEDVKTTLESNFKAYGYEIVGLIVDTPILPSNLADAYNQVMASQRKLETAKNEGEAIRTKMISEAEAEGQSVKIKAQSLADARDITAKGNVQAIKDLIGDTDLTAIEALKYLQGIDARDTLREIGKHGNMFIVPATGEESPLDMTAKISMIKKSS